MSETQTQERAAPPTRISAVGSSPFYPGMDIIRQVVAWLDGVEVERCIEADTEEGWVDVAVFSPEHLRAGDEYIVREDFDRTTRFVRRRGRVEFRRITESGERVPFGSGDA